MESTHTTRAATTETAITRIVDAVADREGVAPTALQPPLYDVIDPEALNALVSSVNGDDADSFRVSFEYNGYEITVGGDGDVSVSDAGSRRSVQSDPDLER
ncbi:HalOD1 output domain-containing protein [Natrinema versiforme]|uniref:Halobacterial output domain-containing protein n=1 Tax=Natrinema versiforme JCM 10478 TaxID=1227496 RepID=L9Y7S0_9EURY|nr:HalOD1 output domain-containing protein [Natrinema versiforme]ELY69701.1 hypothetical protein C489_03982 [Natrinema versiforme JCM 10478]